jgi:hypothetical protein
MVRPQPMNDGFSKTYIYQKRWHGFGFSLILLVLGLFWLLRDLNILPRSISIWPVLLITLGVYWVIAALIKNIFW